MIDKYTLIQIFWHLLKNYKKTQPSSSWFSCSRLYKIMIRFSSLIWKYEMYSPQYILCMINWSKWWSCWCAWPPQIYCAAAVMLEVLFQFLVGGKGYVYIVWIEIGHKYQMRSHHAIWPVKSHYVLCKTFINSSEEFWELCLSSYMGKGISFI